MTISPFAAGTAGPQTASQYRPGVCNIGPAEIARRRRAGHVGLIATVVLLAILIAFGAPPLFRLLVAIPAAIAASGYLQAHLRFCAGFGSNGIYNFGDVGRSEAVTDDVDRRRDRTRSLQISAASFAVGLLVGGAAYLLPI